MKTRIPATVIHFVISAILAAITMIIVLYTKYHVMLILGVFFIYISISALISSYIIPIKHKNKSLPGSSHYNIFGFIELHIGGKAKNNKFTFYKICLKTIEIAKKENTDILFYTWHLSEEKLKERFGEAIEISQPNTIEKICNLIPVIIMRIKPRVLPNPYIKCYLKTNELPEEYLDRYRVNGE